MYNSQFHLDPKANRIVFVLSLLGLIMAIYVLQSFLRQSSVVCLTGGGCEAVRKSSLSYPFGIPVPAFGLLGYLGLTILSFLSTTTFNPKFFIIMLGISIFGICFVTWFTIVEIFLIKGICMWCAISAVNMYLIFGLLINHKLKTYISKGRNNI